MLYFLRPVVPALLLGSLLLAATDARAGTYAWTTRDANGVVTARSPTYSGGTDSVVPAANGTAPPPMIPYNGIGWLVAPSGGCGADAQGIATTVTLKAQGPLNAKFTWQPAYPGEPAPTAVIIYQDSNAQLTDSRNGYFDASSTCTDGLGGSATLPSSSSTGTESYQYVSVTPGADGSMSAPSVSPAASCTVSSGAGSGSYAAVAASVGYVATAYPVTITPYGATPDGHGGWAILVGQHCSPALIGIPDALLNNTAHPPVYQWSVSGTKLQSWKVSDDQKTTTEEDGPGLLNVASPPGWYWNDLHESNETISCMVTLTPPDGQGSPFTVTATQDVKVYVPVWTATGTGGYVKVNLYYNTSNYNQYQIYAGATTPMEVADEIDGMNFNASVSSPAPALFADGNLKLVQLVTPREAETIYNGFSTVVNFPSDYGEEGLDHVYPVPWNTASIPPGPIVFTAGDSPGFVLVDQVTYAATLKHDFKDFLMYVAPGSQQPVPVAHFIWSDDGNAKIPSTGLWSDYAKEHGGSDAVGTVTPSGNNATFLPGDTFPMWTQKN